MLGVLIDVAVMLAATLAWRHAARAIVHRRVAHRVVAERALKGELADIDRYFAAIKREGAFPNRQ